ncbi:MAG: hypothetical protein JWN00_1466, partial [Actinomycetia bacterium]|nr:hypothetical protein [Actinomycetes bacterium]
MPNINDKIQIGEYADGEPAHLNGMTGDGKSRWVAAEVAKASDGNRQVWTFDTAKAKQENRPVKQTCTKCGGEIRRGEKHVAIVRNIEVEHRGNFLERILGRFSVITVKDSESLATYHFEHEPDNDLLAHARTELSAILAQLEVHFEDEARDDQYRLEQLEEQLTAL